MTRIPVLAAAVAVFAAIALSPGRSEAGYNFGTPEPYCYKAADGSGYCMGSWAGFRASSDTTAYAWAYDSSATNAALSFAAYLKSVYYSCVVNPGSPLLSRFGELVQFDRDFVIYWNADGSCREFDFWAESYHTP